MAKGEELRKLSEEFVARIETARQELGDEQFRKATAGLVGIRAIARAVRAGMPVEKLPGQLEQYVSQLVESLKYIQTVLENSGMPAYPRLT